MPRKERLSNIDEDEPTVSSGGGFFGSGGAFGGWGGGRGSSEPARLEVLADPVEPELERPPPPVVASKPSKPDKGSKIPKSVAFASGTAASFGGSFGGSLGGGPIAGSSPSSSSWGFSGASSGGFGGGGGAAAGGLADRISEAVRELQFGPVQRAALLAAFSSSGPEEAKVALERIIDLIKDQSVPGEGKLVAVLVLDYLLDVKAEFLAIQVVVQIKFFSALAKKSKERNPDKQRPSCFPESADPAEVSRFLAGVSELLDKCGRRYANESSGSSLQTFVKVRSQLQRDGVALPEPLAYQHVAPPGAAASGSPAAAAAAPMPSFGAPAAPRAGVGGEELEESTLERMLSDVHTAARKHGPSDVQTAEARAFCESELSRWQAAAAQAAEAGDFARFERLSTVAHRVAAQLHQGPAAGTDGGSSASGSGSGSGGGIGAGPSAFFGAMPQPSSVGLADSAGSPRRRRKDSKSKELNSVFGDVAGGSPSSPTPGAFELGAPSGIVWPATTLDFGAGTSAAAADGGFSQASAVSPSAAGVPLSPSRDGGSDIASAQLQARVDILSQNNASLQAELRRTRQELDTANHALSQSGYGQANHSDALASLANMRETTNQLQHEVDQLRHELRVASGRRKLAEEKCAERDEQLSDTRDRLFAATARVRFLESELENHNTEVAALQGRQRDGRVREQALDRELVRLRFALSRGGQQSWQDAERAPQGLRPGTAGPPGATMGSSVLYGSSGSAALSPGSALVGEARRSSPVRRVHLQDELAAAANAATSRSDALDSECDAMTFNDDIGASPAPRLPPTPADVWARTPRTEGAPSALTMRSPLAAPELVERVCANFRQLLTSHRGLLLEDDHVALELNFPLSHEYCEPGGCACEIVVRNRGGRVLQGVAVVPVGSCGTDDLASSTESPVRLSVEDTSAEPGGPLRPGQRSQFLCRVHMLSPFEVAPQVELSYLLHDDLACRSRLRLPLTVAKLMRSVQISGGELLEFWASPEFARAEVAFVCPARRPFLESGGLFLLDKCLELGGALHPMQGVDSHPQGAVLVGAFGPQQRGAETTVLVRAELGDPRSHGDVRACRVAVRSANYLINRGLAHAILDVLSDCAGIPALAA